MVAESSRIGFRHLVLRRRWVSARSPTEQPEPKLTVDSSGLGGLTVPFIASALLKTYGRRITCIAFSIAYALLLTLTIPFIRPRLPLTNRLTDADAQRERARIDWGFLRGRAFRLFRGYGSYCKGWEVSFQGHICLVSLNIFSHHTLTLKTSPSAFAVSIHLGNPTGTLSLALSK
jgi:hypothetical protein